jgi:uncharacterized protein (TIGR02117 family)
MGLFIAAPFFMVILYLLASLVGGLLPSGVSGKFDAEEATAEHTVYLVSNALHADIAIPVNDMTRQQFSFLRQSGFPIDNPNLKYLVIGWGSHDFYTSTAEYSDIKLSTIWKAATGDRAVMHVAPAGDISASDSAMRIPLGPNAFGHLLEYVLDSFKTRNDKPVPLPEATFGYGDVFYEAEGHFNIFHPCNVWVSKALSMAGVSTGIWTPTTYSLFIHHKLYH